MMKPYVREDSLLSQHKQQQTGKQHVKDASARSAKG